ncbi:MAG: hypothetical protein A2V85_11525 [Chloroflexi bacterium RBG_16_72_14]|nr:MAG: hypothetical protein A2V85_11525 [Chloroflexi bacterium RBG_16_72_14]
MGGLAIGIEPEQRLGVAGRLAVVALGEPHLGQDLERPEVDLGHPVPRRAGPGSVGAGQERPCRDHARDQRVGPGGIDRARAE